jgi:hypothetical protein
MTGRKGPKSGKGVGPKACGSRPRPEASFDGIEANSFNRSLKGDNIIDLSEFDQTQTYDWVHYTTRGNAVLFDAFGPPIDGSLENL